MKRFAAILMLGAFWFWPLALAQADELKPSYLDIREVAADAYAIVWKTPTLGDLRLRLRVVLPKTCESQGGSVRSTQDDMAYERWGVSCPGGLKGKSIEIGGLSVTPTDVLVRVAGRDGATELSRLTQDTPSIVVRGRQTTLELAKAYFFLGVDHILTSLDHLLFVLALMMLIRNGWALLKTVTAFTLAHSMTLAGTTLGYLSLPQKPVEATIALSIVFLAGEVVKMDTGARRPSQMYPWIAAFGFGLLHGFGFAGALKEIGLPQTDVPLALIVFNLGIEAGQLLFVVTLLFGYRAVVALYDIASTPVRKSIGYCIGVVSAVWFFERLIGIAG